jgi:hypothetical protein
MCFFFYLFSSFLFYTYICNMSIKSIFVCMILIARLLIYSFVSKWLVFVDEYTYIMCINLVYLIIAMLNEQKRAGFKQCIEITSGRVPNPGFKPWGLPSGWGKFILVSIRLLGSGSELCVSPPLLGHLGHLGHLEDRKSSVPRLLTVQSFLVLQLHTLVFLGCIGNCDTYMQVFYTHVYINILYVCTHVNIMYVYVIMHKYKCIYICICM